MPYVTASGADQTARAVGSKEQRSLVRSRGRSAPLLHRLRTLRQIAGPTGRREIDKGIGAAAAERNDMIAFEALVRTAIGVRNPVIRWPHVRAISLVLNDRD